MSIETPLVSIITCTYNRAHLIGETIQSVLKQTFQNFEYIIIDDGSTDNTKQIVETFSDQRISYTRVDHTKGHLTKLRNLGISKSTGDYIAFIDSDDLWHPTKLQRQIDFLQNNKTIGFSFTDISLFNASGIIRSSIHHQTGEFTGSILRDLLKNKTTICATTLFFRKSCWRDLDRMDERLAAGDFDFILRLAANYNVFAIFEPLVSVRKHDQNTTKTLLREEAEGYLIPLHKLTANDILPAQFVNEILSNFSYSFAVQFARQKEHDYAKLFLEKSIHFDPTQWKAYVRLIQISMQNILRR